MIFPPSLPIITTIVAPLSVLLLSVVSVNAERYISRVKDIPKIGLGTWLSDREKVEYISIKVEYNQWCTYSILQVAHAVEYALDSGYNHIDAALIYRTNC